MRVQCPIEKIGVEPEELLLARNKLCGRGYLVIPYKRMWQISVRNVRVWSWCCLTWIKEKKEDFIVYRKRVWQQESGKKKLDVAMGALDSQAISTEAVERSCLDNAIAFCYACAERYQLIHQ